MNTSAELGEFAAQITAYMETSLRHLSKTLTLLAEEDVWKRPNDQSNSVGNLLLHLNGNITQWVLSSLGGRPDQRERDEEFAAREGFSKQEMYERLEATVNAATKVIREAGSEEMLRRRVIQGYEISGIGIAVHVCEHLSYHVGQIAFWVKLLKNKDLGLYDDWDLNALNQ